MTRRPTIGRPLAPLAAAVALALASAGCGAPAPQAPFAQAKKLDSATGDIAAACGLSYQVTAFPGDHEADLAELEASATSSAHKLVTVYARNPAWVYQGETVSEIVDDGVTMLRACGLRDAAMTLSAAERHRASGSGG